VERTENGGITDDNGDDDDNDDADADNNNNNNLLNRQQHAEPAATPGAKRYKYDRHKENTKNGQEEQ